MCSEACGLGAAAARAAGGCAARVRGCAAGPCVAAAMYNTPVLGARSQLWGWGRVYR